MHEVGEGMDNCILWQRRRYDDQITKAGFVVILFVCCASDLLVVCGADQVREPVKNVLAEFVR